MTSLHNRRIKLVMAYERTGSYTKAAKAENSTTRTVREWVSRYRATGDVCDAPRTGRPKKGLQAPAAQQVLKRGVAKRFSCSRLAADIKKKLNIVVCDETVRRALKGRGSRSLKPVRKPRLTEKHKTNRLKFSKQWRRRSWRNVMVSDSKIFHLYRQGAGYRVWVERGDDPPTQNAVRGGCRVHVYAAVSKWGITPLFETAGTTGAGYKGGVNSHIYVELLRDRMLPACRKLMQNRYGNDWIFQQDGASAHTAKSTMAFIHQQEFKLMDGWPACSPDLSWIENLSSWVERKLRELAETLTEENFAQKLHETWNSIPTSLLQSLHGSIQSRLQECIDKKGSSTHY